MGGRVKGHNAKREGVRRRRMQEEKNQKRQNKFRERETERAGVGEWNK